MSLILERKIIELTPIQSKMIISGWGEDALNNAVVEKVTYLSDGLKVKGYIAYPKEIIDPKLPCIIWNRGGYKESGAIDRFTAKGIFGMLAAQGYVVLSTQYRGNDGSEGKDEIGGSEINDIKNLLKASEELEIIDPNRIGVIGWSRGGMMALLSIIRELLIPKAVVLVGAVSDFKSYYQINNKFSGLLSEKISDPEHELNIRTAIDKVDLLAKIPYLIIHGGMDEVVPVEQSLTLAQNMTKHGHYYKLVVFEEGDHILKNYKKETDELTMEWIKRFV